jgi:hypothetical protein
MLHERAADVVATRGRSPDSDGGSAAITMLWAGYLVTLPFHRLWVLPWLGIKFQPPEVVFLGLVIASTVMWWRGRAHWRFTFADVAAASWLAANLLALAWSSEPRGRAALIEALGSAYVVGLYVVVRFTATSRLLDQFGQWFAWSAALAAALGIVGSLASDAGLANRLATVAAHTAVPYVGQAARAHAFTAGPQMLASILLMAIPLLIAARMQLGWRRRDYALVVVLVLGLAATLSKTALCLAAALSVMWTVAPQTPERPSRLLSRTRVWLAVVVVLVVTSVFGLGSHLMVLREAAVPGNTAAQLVGGSAMASLRWRDEAWVVMPTTYVFNKRASWQAIKHSWPLGLGPAGQPFFTAKLQGDGQFPPTIGFITPHSTYLGSVAELGAAGLAALLLLLGTGAATIRQLLARPSGRRWEPAAYAGIGAAFLIEATSTDLLNCRHYWLLFAVMAARHALPPPVSLGPTGSGSR